MSDHSLPFVDVNPEGKADAVVIWLHGLGDSGNGFAPIVPELKLPSSLNIRFVFPHAPVRPVTINGGMPMRAWYDIQSLDIDKRADLAGVKDSAEQVRALVEAEMARGVPAERIVLAGFSQGGVIALYLAPRFEHKLAGIMALSTYMCDTASLSSEKLSANQNTPIFMAHGQMDDVVPMALGKMAHETLVGNGFQVNWRDYPMQHNVCPQEIADISEWLQQRLG